MHICIGSIFLCAKRMGAPYGLMLRQIQPRSRYVSSCLYTSTYSAGDKRYCLGLGGWASGSNKVMSCVMHGPKAERQVPRTCQKTHPIKQKSMGH